MRPRGNLLISTVLVRLMGTKIAWRARVRRVMVGAPGKRVLRVWGVVRKKKEQIARGRNLSRMLRTALTGNLATN